MQMLRRCLLVSAVLLIPACQGKERDTEPSPPPPSATKAPGPAAKPVRPVTCRVESEVDAALREVLVGHARRLVTALRGGAAQPLWNDLHPDLRRPDGREGFLAALAGLQERLRGTEPEVAVSRVVHIEVVPGLEEAMKIDCGRATETPDDDLTVTTRVDGEDLAMVWLEAAGPAVVESVLVRLRKRGNDWHLTGIEGNPIRLGERAATDAEHRGDELSRGGKPVPAYLQYGVAQTLNARGGGIATPDQRRVEEKLRSIMKDPGFRKATASVELDGRSVELIRLGLTSSPAGVAPSIKYVTSHSLDQADEITGEASALVAALLKLHPEISEAFDTARVEAYREKPVDPNKAYDAFQTIVTLRPAATGD